MSGTRPENAAREAVASPVPRVCLRVAEAAAALGVSPDFFGRHVASELRWIRRGSVRLVAVAELEAWADREARRTLEDER